MVSITHKVEAGKMLRIDYYISEDRIDKITITGDFFVYPEDGVEIIEKDLVGKSVSEVDKVVDKTISDNKLTVVGFKGKDVMEALNK